MPTHRQLSFIAEISSQGADLNLLETLLGKPAKVILPGTGGGVFSGRFNERDDSHLLCHQAASVPQRPMKVYFRHTDKGYTLSVHSPGNHFGKCLCRDDNGAIAVYRPEDVTPSYFEMVGPQGEITLTDKPINPLICLLRERSSGKCLHRQRRHDSKHMYLFAKHDQFLPIRINILEYKNEPDEG
ncbi:hypothetical protein NJF44_23385 [Pseudomonas guariconensis]|uniref:hypothetical protein n=1 Tax=Pseudomonas TaxID=286 RepID=UPI001CE3CA68|nr:MULTISPECIES: hypothetical protein [Pseudomonas]MCO7642033.1 hypothetical protein [Pseudomonas sp. S 311-6]MCO7517729.1 hypothetical protein [Pseudomonas putida]MCO7567046.1 hypothetical protein [Pseudomonas mosselii]MCO7597128.1 hypothetical protein [Pseudomonas guariconensis]MCO7608182.1 hypothetical protein [Pseudomonas guariconensis]